jgi:hypothetical protein
MKFTLPVMLITGVLLGACNSAPKVQEPTAAPVTVTSIHHINPYYRVVDMYARGMILIEGGQADVSNGDEYVGQHKIQAGKQMVSDALQLYADVRNSI